MIIAFMGEYASGKDFLCNHLVQNYGAQRLSFSDEVRRLAVTIFPWLPFDFDPAVKDKPYEHPRNPNGLTPRDIWLLVGKVREVTPGYFVDAFYHNNFFSLDQSSTQLRIITDLRTQQEWQFVRDMGIPVIKIERESRVGLIPSDFEDFVRKFKDYDALYINKLDGTERFDAFFQEFTKQRGYEFNAKYAAPAHQL